MSIKGRPRRYSQYENILENHPPKSMSKRPIYSNGIGVFRGKTGDNAYLKIFLRHPIEYKGRGFAAGHSLEIPVGKLSSWDWASLEILRDDLQKRADRGEKLEDSEVVSFELFSTSWLERAKVRQKSFQTSKYTFQHSLLPFFGQKHLTNITVRDVNDWQTNRLRFVKPATVQREKNLLKAILNTAVREGFLQSNPCLSSDRIKGIEERLRLWTADEIQRVIRTAEEIDPLFKLYVLWALYSAMRKSEILRLQWHDVKKLPDNSLIIHLTTSKSDKPRKLPCNEQMLLILDEVKKLCPTSKNSIFPLSQKTIQRRLDKVRKLTSIPDIRLHDLRTIHITFALTSGVDPKTLTGITGHTDLQMIHKFYSVVVDKTLNEASKRSGNFIDGVLNSRQ